MSTFSKSVFLGYGSRVACLKTILSEVSFSCASDGAIDQPHGINYGPKIAKLHFRAMGP